MSQNNPILFPSEVKVPELEEFSDDFILHNNQLYVDWNRVGNVLKSSSGGPRVVYEGEVVANESDAFFTINIPENIFAEPPKIFITGFALKPETNTAAGNAAFACLFPSSITTTRARGRAKTANSAGLLAAMVLTNAVGAIVQFIAIGKPYIGDEYALAA